MNKTQRRFRTPQIPRRNDSLNRFKHGVRAKVSTGIEVLHPPLKAVRKSRSRQKNVASRCCYVSPQNKSFGQYFAKAESLKHCTDAAVGPAQPVVDDQVRSFLIEQKLEPGKSVISNLKEPKKVSRSSGNKMKSSTQCASPGRSSHSPKKAPFDESHWLKLDSPEDVDTIIGSKDDSPLERPSNQMFISDVPRVKVIAEKFSKYKKGNLELRRLDEKVVCVEYDVFNQSSNHELLKPVQRLRTFFSIKPSCDKDSKDQGLPRLPPNIKNEFDVLEEDLEKLTEKEIEFIDTDIEENQSYLDDLRRILKRKEVISAHKNRTTLDLQCLYEMARSDGRPLKTDFSAMNLLTKAELQEVKQLILERCTSSIHGFRRRTIKKQGSPLNPSAISDNLMSEMLRCQT